MKAMKFQEFLSIKESLQAKGTLNESIDSRKTRQLIKEYIDTVGLENAIRLDEADDFLSRMKSVINYGIALSMLSKYEEEYKKGGSKEVMDIAFDIKKWPLDKQLSLAQGNKEKEEKIKRQKEAEEVKIEVEKAKLEEVWRKFKEEWDEIVGKIQDDYYKSEIAAKKNEVEAKVKIAALEAKAKLSQEKAKTFGTEAAKAKAKEQLEKIKSQVKDLSEKMENTMQNSIEALEANGIDENEVKSIRQIVDSKEWKNFTTENAGWERAKNLYDSAKKTGKYEEQAKNLAAAELERNKAFNAFRKFVEGQKDKVGNTVKAMAGLEYTKSKGENKGKKVKDTGELETDKEKILKKYKIEDTSEE